MYMNEPVEKYVLRNTDDELHPQTKTTNKTWQESAQKNVIHNKCLF